MSLSTGQQINNPPPLVAIIPATQALATAQVVIASQQSQINAALTIIETAVNKQIITASALGALDINADFSSVVALNRTNSVQATEIVNQFNADLSAAGYVCSPANTLAPVINVSWAPQVLQQANQQVLNLLQ